ncbi:MAG: hypothetical protein A3D65_00880 [Candidatus Lloydbacteria bacterium RIFCSPHIGHO2_02_FULL_50_13]|uniref:Primosomal protein N' 3' DNA-binding domain-containing protein n=1 Tax=Candidatus Lloydbacteria bacterium RIFCSPHIGHO2_02_FULL_50_13 TaxID=1798661 RepID=A0A1G2D216_9BACT|nr:MAG: hypothetical protein A3D65_00880 [Candidatus Lloydbacteria bacterium RIFCSPHIGHO2_02_FULL_50_13]
MYVITVAPIKRGIPVDELSYFTTEDLPPGALVTVPLRGRQTPALVIRSTKAEDAKSEIKQAQFALKKLNRINAKHFFRQEFIEACEKTAEYFAASVGAVIHSTFPNALILSKKVASLPRKVTAKPKRRSEKYIFQAEESERLAAYKSHIREVFAKNASCYFVLPSIQDIEHAYAGLEKGIQEYTFVLHGGLSKKELEGRWEKIITMAHPVLIIGTPLFLAIPRYDIESIILERESAGAYMREGRPFVDLRYFAEAFATAIGADLILGDLFLRAETLYRKDQGEFEQIQRPKYRLPSLATQEIVDMRASGEQPATGRVAIASAALVNMLEEVREKGTRCFVLGVRRGFAPMTVCGDCGTVVSCERCNAPLVLHRKNQSSSRPMKSGEAGAKQFHGVNHQSEDSVQWRNSPGIKNRVVKASAESAVDSTFLCHRCGFVRTTKTLCSYCKSWRLTPLGIGITQAEETIRKRFTDAPLFRLDRDSVKNHAKAREIAEKFYRTPGSILIGTEMAIPYLTNPVAAVAVLSVNSLLTIPDFRMGERIFRLLLILREKAREHFLIQTRDPNVPLFALATEGNIGEYLRAELETRHRFGYPPFSTLLKFTFEGKKQDGATAMNEIEKIFGAYHPVTFPSFIARVKNKYRMNALIKIPPGGWPNSELLGLVRALPPEIEVRVNPESVI